MQEARRRLAASDAPSASDPRAPASVVVYTGAASPPLAPRLAPSIIRTHASTPPLRTASPGMHSPGVQPGRGEPSSVVKVEMARPPPVLPAARQAPVVQAQQPPRHASSQSILPVVSMAPVIQQPVPLLAAPAAGATADLDAPARVVPLPSPSNADGGAAEDSDLSEASAPSAALSTLAAGAALPAVNVLQAFELLQQRRDELRRQLDWIETQQRQLLAGCLPASHIAALVPRLSVMGPSALPGGGHGGIIPHAAHPPAPMMMIMQSKSASEPMVADGSDAPPAAEVTAPVEIAADAIPSEFAADTIGGARTMAPQLTTPSSNATLRSVSPASHLPWILPSSSDAAVDGSSETEQLHAEEGPTAEMLLSLSEH